MKLRMPTVDDLHERRERHLARSRAYRIAFGLAAVTLVLIGLVLWLFPVVPGGVLAFVGLAMLALEFAWAERLLTRALGAVERFRDRRRRHPETRNDAKEAERREAV